MANNKKYKSNNNGKKDFPEKESNNGRSSKRRSGKGSNSAKASSGSAGSIKASSALLSAAANISFPVAAGYPIHLGESSGDGVLVRSEPGVLRIPGVMRFGYLPTFGPMKDWTSPANVWIRDWFTFIRHHNSGSTNYDAGALGYYGLAMRSCADFLTWMQRIYGVTRGSYVPNNQYTPYDIVKACGGDYDDIIRHMADLRFYIASFAARMSIMKIPNFPIFHEGKDLLNNVFADTDSNKASFYIFTPDGFWKLHTGTTPEDTYMEVKPAGPVMTFDEIVALGEELLNAILNSEDFNIMSGDIAKAYTEFYSPSVIDEDFILTPVYDPAFLWQVHNASYMHSSWEDAENSILQWKIRQQLDENDNAGALSMFAPVMLHMTTTRGLADTNAAMLCMGKLIDLPTEPTPAMVGAVSRFALIATSEILRDEDNNTVVQPVINIDSCQTEVITSCVMITRPRGTFVPMDWNSYEAVSRFDMVPYVFTVPSIYYPPTAQIMLEFDDQSDFVIGEITNPTIMNKSVKDNIDMAVMLEKFGG